MKKILCTVLIIFMFWALVIPAFATENSSEIQTDISDEEGSQLIPHARIDPSNPSTPSIPSMQSILSSYYSQKENYMEQILAGEYGKNWSKTNICTDETDEYKKLLLGSMTEYTIDEEKTMTIKDSWEMSSNCSLIINGVLNGTLTNFNINTVCTVISIGDNGRIDLNCSDKSVATALAEQLNTFGLSPKVTENNVLVRKYPACFYEGHSWNDFDYCTVCGIKNECAHQWVDGKCSVCKLECTHDWQNRTCKICGMNETMYEILQHLNGGSTLSEGSLTIIVGIAAAVVFGFGGFFLGTKKKKKPALAGGAENTDEE